MQIKEYKQGSQTEYSSGPLKFQGWLPNLSWRITAQQQLSIHSPHISMMLVAHQFEFSSKKKVVLHLCIPLEMHKEPCYSELQLGLYLKDAMTEWRNQMSASGHKGPMSTQYRTTNARSHRGNSYFLAFSLLCLEISRRC